MTSYRSALWWVSVLCGVLAVAMAIAVLRVGASAPAAVQITGSAQGAQAARSYDIVVTAPGPGGPGNAAGWTATPAQLDTLYGGITLAQYKAISQLPGVAVAAPLTMVGFVPFTVSAPVAVPASLRSASSTSRSGPSPSAPRSRPAPRYGRSACSIRPGWQARLAPRHRICQSC